ncbi:hypothetical protein OpiT1DRAFT_03150 [Opitutaceae bacterium TAV1]|nr:hypothetical protein OpiT1DRAFT_03150 [Opitutaceae bacterium TAV1]
MRTGYALFLPHANIQYSQLPPGRRLWVIENSYEKLFDLVAEGGYRIGFEASGETLRAMHELAPSVLAKLKRLVAAGQVEGVGSPYTHIMLANLPPEVGLKSLKDGMAAWEDHVGVRPRVGWNPECSWADFIPDIYKAAGYEALVMDGDSLLLSFDEIRQATGLSFDVRGHSNKNKLFRIEDCIADKDRYLRYLTNCSTASNGLKLIFRSDFMGNPMLWYLMGATEGCRQSPVSPGEIDALFKRWRDRVARTGNFILPYAEDAEYIGTSAYFYVKQFGQARFFEPEPDSVARFREMLECALKNGYTLATPGEVLDLPQAPLANDQVASIENGIAWHGGTAKAWLNTGYSRVLDPVCQMILDGLKNICAHLGKDFATANGNIDAAFRRIISAYVSDCRWPPAPTSPGRFNVRECLDDLRAANDLLARIMADNHIATRRSLYSSELMKSQIDAVEEELMALPYFGEKSVQPAVAPEPGLTIP